MSEATANVDAHGHAESVADEHTNLGVSSEYVVWVIRVALEGFLLSTIALVGVLGNVLSMFILLFKKTDIQPFLCRLLVLLVVFDTLFLLSEMLSFSLALLSDHYYLHILPKVTPLVLHPLLQISLTGSVYTMLAITLERWLACCWPHLPKRDGSRINLGVITGITIFSIVYNLPRFFEYREHIDPNGTPMLMATPFRNDPSYMSYYVLLANTLVMVLVPLMLLVVFNWQIRRAIKKRELFRSTLGGKSASNLNTKRLSSNHKERESSITQILMAIVVIFFCCQSFKVVVVSYEVCSYLVTGKHGNENPFPLWVEVVISLNHVALAINAAINIAIYICKDKKFRAACMAVLVLPSFCRPNTDMTNSIEDADHADHDQGMEMRVRVNPRLEVVDGDDDEVVARNSSLSNATTCFVHSSKKSSASHLVISSKSDL